MGFAERANASTPEYAIQPSRPVNVLDIIDREESPVERSATVLEMALVETLPQPQMSMDQKLNVLLDIVSGMAERVAELEKRVTATSTAASEARSILGDARAEMRMINARNLSQTVTEQALVRSEIRERETRDRVVQKLQPADQFTARQAFAMLHKAAGLSETSNTARDALDGNRNPENFALPLRRLAAIRAAKDQREVTGNSALTTDTQLIMWLAGSVANTGMPRYRWFQTMDLKSRNERYVSAFVSMKKSDGSRAVSDEVIRVILTTPYGEFPGEVK